jgi:hypothetical protein
MVYAEDLKSLTSNGLWVRVPPPAQKGIHVPFTLVQAHCGVQFFRKYWYILSLLISMLGATPASAFAIGGIHFTYNRYAPSIQYPTVINYAPPQTQYQMQNYGYGMYAVSQQQQQQQQYGSMYSYQPMYSSYSPMPTSGYNSYSMPTYSSGSYGNSSANMYPNSYSSPTGRTDGWGTQLCNWSDYPTAAPCGTDPQQWLQDPYTGRWY